MTLFITSFVAGFLTILAPCILPLLPVTLGGSVSDTGNRRRPFVIILSLSLSVFVFTLLLKGSTALISVSPTFWTYVSAVVLGLFGLTLMFPTTWARLMLKVPGHNKPEGWMATGYKNRGSWWADVLVGAALGPVFTTCSPTFFVILATVLPQSLGVGLIDLLAYIVGLALALLLVAYIGQRLIDKLGWATNPYGWFRKILGILFVAVAIVIASGFDKKIEISILDSGFFDVTKLEQVIRSSLDGSPEPQTNTEPIIVDAVSPVVGTTTNNSMNNTPVPAKKISGEIDGGRYVEIVNPSGFINSEDFRLADLVGKQVILLDFIDYSCINCQRTFPYMNRWWDSYKDSGLVIVAIHTPEFSFERDIKNVTAAAQKFGLNFPIVLDNQYATWNAYKNKYWPHKYIIDIKGNVVYEHIGEGNYAETEEEIVKQLNIRMKALGETGNVSKNDTPLPVYNTASESPETYLGSLRNSNFGNGTAGISGDSSYVIPSDLVPNKFYLGDKWHIDGEYAAGLNKGSQISYVFTAKNVYLVVESTDGKPVTATVLIDGQSISSNNSGADVKDSKLIINGSRLYHLYSGTVLGRHRIDIIFDGTGARVYTFTFG